ncbi:MAG: type IV pilus secretin PilQ [Nannocystaceae bacterium]
MRRVTKLAAALGILWSVSALNAADVSARVSGISASAQKSTESGFNELKGLRIEELRDGTTTLRLIGSRKPTFNVYRLADPDRVIVDLSGSRPKGVVPQAVVDNWTVGRVRITAAQEDGSSLSRVIVGLKRDASYIIVPSGNDLLVTITPRDLPPEAYFGRQSAAKRKHSLQSREKSVAAAERDAQVKVREAEAEANAAKRHAVAAQSDKVRAQRDRLQIEEQARATRAEARRLLRRAERAERAAMTEHKRAVAAREDAERDQARAKADKISRREAARVEARSKAALRRVEEAEKTMARLADHRKTLARTLKRQQQESQRLEASIAERRVDLEKVQVQVATARRDVKRLGGSVTQADLQRARDETRRAEARQAVVAKEVSRLQAELANKKGAQDRAKQAKGRRYLDRREQTLAGVERDVVQTRAQLAQMETEFRALEQQTTALRRKNKTARSKLRSAEDKLAKVDKSISRESTRLGVLEAKIEHARVNLDRSVSQAVGGAPTKRAVPEPPRGAGVVLARVEDVRFEDSATESRVIVTVAGPMRYTARNLTPWMKSLRFRNTHLPERLARNLDTSAYQGPVGMITTVHDGDDVKLIVTSTHSVAARVDVDGGELVWTFPRKHKRGRARAVSLSAPKVAGFVVAPVMASMAQSRYVRKREKWRGERIDIEIQDSPIKDVLLLFSDLGQVNIIAGTGVQGNVTMRLKSVPWDQAFDIILRSLSLGMVQEGNVIRVASIAALEEERRKAIERANAQVRLKPLETRLIPLSYATVADMTEKVQSVLSSRGTVTPDSRTNTLIVMDVAENIALAEQLVNQLDGQTPQVVIEARIVEARTSWLRQLGIQWGFDYIASAGTGNPTGLLFPNSVGVAGGSGSASGGATPGFILPHAVASPNYAVDLPAPVGTGAGGALGFSFGSISGNLNTNLRLSAAEDVGEVRIISAPRIVAMDNVQAQIEQGVQIPVSQVSAQGVNTRYVNATLALRVVPHVTNEGSVILDVSVQKNEADFINTGARGDPTILTKQAQSRMLITDGDTAVIGGINTRNTSINRKKVPWIADLPIIGWFFKNKSEADTRTEVLIFLTPKIVNRAASIGG